MEFGHYGCEHCRKAKVHVDRQMTQYAGKVKLYFTPDIPWPDPLFERLSLGAEAAARQGKYREMHTALFDESTQQGFYTLYDNRTLSTEQQAEQFTQKLTALAATLQLDQARFARDLADPAVLAAVRQRQAMADEFKMKRTPAFVFLAPGKQPVLLHNADQLDAWLADPAHW